jgi:hypothetical protein
VEVPTACDRHRNGGLPVMEEVNRSAGISAFRFPIVMWRSCSPSGACAPTTSLSGGGSSGYAPELDRRLPQKAQGNKRLLAGGRVSGVNHPSPRVINTDKHAGYPRDLAKAPTANNRFELERSTPKERRSEST